MFEEYLKKILNKFGPNNFTRIIKADYEKYKKDFDELFNKLGQSDWKYINLYIQNKLNKCPVCGRYCIKKTCSKECSKKYSYSLNEFKELLKNNTFKNSLIILMKKYGNRKFTNYAKKLYTHFKSEFDELFKEIGSNDFTFIQLYLNGKLSKCECCGKIIKLPRAFCSIKCSLVKRDYSKIDYSRRGDKISESLNKKTDEEKIETVKKRKETNLKLYGNENYTNREKAEETSLKKFGTNSYCKTDYFKKKIQDYYKNRSEEQKQLWFQRQKETKLKRHGNENYNGENNWVNKDLLFKEYIIENFVEDEIVDITKFKDFYNMCSTSVYTLIKKLGLKTPLSFGKSQEEKKLFKWIPIENKVSNTRGIISPYELDIYLPDFNLAIEYNGSYWHSEGRKEKEYHLNKTNLCNEKDIQLLHIFDFDDLDIWKSMISNKLGLNEKIYARKCIIKELEYKDVKDFLNENHLQGSCPSKINLGLFYNEELVEVMTFGKPRFNKKYNYELLRLCTKKYTNLIGGASKLFKYFTRKYKGSIISYANRRFSNGNIYNQLGFKELNKTEPNYWYTKKDKILSRYQCQKHKLNSLLEDFNPELSEYENMSNNGYFRIYDCGNIVYEFVSFDF